jgi:hypothetical protein
MPRDNPNGSRRKIRPSSSGLNGAVATSARLTRSLQHEPLAARRKQRARHTSPPFRGRNFRVFSASKPNFSASKESRIRVKIPLSGLTNLRPSASPRLGRTRTTPVSECCRPPRGYTAHRQGQGGVLGVIYGEGNSSSVVRWRPHGHRRSGLLRGLMFLHMKAGLDADVIHLRFSQETYPLEHTPLTPSGVRKFRRLWRSCGPIWMPSHPTSRPR